MAKVLIVDDDADIRHLLDQRLRRQGHDVISAASAVEALGAIARYGEPDIAVLDIVMPEISGLELLKRLRDCDCARMSAIFLTARCLDSDLERARSMGASYLRKPFAFADLTNAIEDIGIITPISA